MVRLFFESSFKHLKKSSNQVRGLSSFNRVKLEFGSVCDAPKPGGSLTIRQPAEYKWRSGYPTPL